MMLIDQLKQISTKKGDLGQSRNYNNEVFDKDNIIFETLGSIDELSSFLGLTYHEKPLEMIKRIQTDLQHVNSLVATSPNSDLYARLTKIEEQHVVYLELEIQSLLDQAPLSNQFYLPGSEKSKIGAYFDVCRTLARKSERCIVRFVKEHQRTDFSFINQYINRLSDLLFLMSFK